MIRYPLLAVFFLIFVHQDVFGQVTWESLSTPLESRVEAPSIVIDNKYYVFGGFQTLDIVPTATTEVFDFSTRSWTPFSSLPYPVTHSGVALVDKKIWIVGGFALIGYTQNIATANIYDTETDTWSEGPPLPAVRASGTMTLLGRKLHFFGGLKNRNDDVGDHYVLDVDDPSATWQSAAPLPFPRNHLSSAAVGGKIYAVGGQFFHDMGRVDQVYLHEYDPHTDIWTRKADLPTVRSHYEASTFVEDGRIVIVGGRADPLNAVDYVTAYDVVKDEWSELFTMEEALIGPGAKLYQDSLFVSHGATPNVRFPQASFRKTPFPRNPSDTLGFWPDLISFSPDADSTLDSQTILWTFSDTADYVIDLNDLPSWITSVGNATGQAPISGAEITISFDARGLQPGLYSHRLTATAPNYQTAAIDVQIEIQPQAIQVDQPLSAGWNLIGLPLDLSERDYTDIFDTITLTGPPFGFDGSRYIKSDTLLSGQAYWIKVASAGAESYTGFPIEQLTLSLFDGWNMIAPPSCTLPVALLQDTDAILVPGTLFSFDPNAGYQPASSLEPGQGYWIKTSQEGSITMDCDDLQASSLAAKTPFQKATRKNTFHFVDANLQRVSLALQDHSIPQQLPPYAPGAFLDVRFSDNTRNSIQTEQIVHIVNGTYPVRLLAGEEKIRVELPGKGIFMLEPGHSVTLSEEDKRLMVQLVEESPPFKTLTILDVFPNPVKEEASMRVRLPEEVSSLELQVFDLQGRQVHAQPLDKLKGGQDHVIHLDAANWPAGVYLYLLKSSQHVIRGSLVRIP